MSPRRLSWRRRRDTSTSSQASAPEPYHQVIQPQFQPLHRSMSDLSPVSPLADRETFISDLGRGFTISGFSRRHASQDSTLVNTRQEYVAYRPYYQRPEPTLLSGPPLITSFVEDTSTSVAPHTTQSTTPWPMRVDSMAQSYGLQPTYMGFNPVEGNGYQERGYDPSSQSQLSAQHTFMTSPTSYSGSSEVVVERRAHNRARLSRPAGTLHLTYPPTSSPPMRRDSEAIDEFTSPTDFALFAEATSSLDISPAPSPNPAMGGGWSRTPEPSPAPAPVSYAPAAPYSRPQPTAVSSTRLAAPLPPLPTQTRSRSSPASVPAVRRQASQQEMIAEALAGLGIEDRVGSDDDELPNYEQSQAEVMAAKRREAAARARELDEAWMRSRRRGG
ncbi:hypothetical protein, variant [Verruconis gallopava]|nr:hypothetical protein, variant [Verruconis gallopava]KIW01227.1 hypothetical protein, variant [Verruconis gallopava]